MPRPSRRIVLAAFLCLVLAGPYHAARAGLTLSLTDGSHVTVGEVAAVSDAAVTVAATGTGVRVERSIPWHRIAGARLDGESYSTAELRLALGLPADATMLASHVEQKPMPFVAPPFGACGPCPPFPSSHSPFPTVGRVIGVRPDPLAAYGDLGPAVYPVGVPSTEAPFALGVLRERRRIEAVGPFAAPVVPAPPFAPALPLPTGDAIPGELSQIEARVTPIRADGGADVSALGVEVVGLDAAGRVVPVEGTAQFFLYAGDQKLVRAFDDVYAAKPQGLVRLAEWTRAVLPDASLVLRLPDPLPEHDPTVTTVGTLRVRLSVPGRGVFEALAEPVPLRPASPFRDAVRSETGSRFLPDEKTTGRRDATWPRERDLSSVE
ncbi:MAG TPA: hypothetical protein VF170_10080 [Planctomycetaceae bacterium]